MNDGEVDRYTSVASQLMYDANIKCSSEKYNTTIVGISNGDMRATLSSINWPSLRISLK